MLTPQESEQLMSLRLNANRTPAQNAELDALAAKENAEQEHQEVAEAPREKNLPSSNIAAGIGPLKPSLLKPILKPKAKHHKAQPKHRAK